MHCAGSRVRMGQLSPNVEKSRSCTNKASALVSASFMSPSRATLLVMLSPLNWRVQCSSTQVNYLPREGAVFRRFSCRDFELIGTIDPTRNEDGAIEEYFPQHRYRDAATARLHAYGEGPFCRFSVARGITRGGLYIITVNEAPVYAGECENLSKRYDSTGYGGISPRNCFHGGQPTNCRINALILAEAKCGSTIELWFHPTSGEKTDRLGAETDLIQSLRPIWNRAGMG